MTADAPLPTTWQPTPLPHSALLDQPVEINLLVEEDAALTTLDLDLVARVVRDVDTYVVAALEHLHAHLAADPAFYGLTPGAAADLVGRLAVDLPLERAQANFYADEWHLRFAEGDLPLCDPYGVSVVFAGTRPVRVEDLSDAEPVDP